MALSFKDEQRDGVTVLTLSGRLVLGDESNQLRGVLKSLISEGHKNILVDLGEVPYIDSAGLGTLVAGFTSAQSAGGTMKLANLTKKITEQLHITKLVTVFEVFDSVEAGVRSFSDSHPTS